MQPSHSNICRIASLSDQEIYELYDDVIKKYPNLYCVKRSKYDMFMDTPYLYQMTVPIDLNNLAPDKRKYEKEAIGALEWVEDTEGLQYFYDMPDVVANRYFSRVDDVNIDVLYKALYELPNKIIVLPCVLLGRDKGVYTGLTHSTTILIDKEKKAIMYFDPHGLDGVANKYFKRIIINTLNKRQIHVKNRIEKLKNLIQEKKMTEIDHLKNVMYKLNPFNKSISDVIEEYKTELMTLVNEIPPEYPIDAKMVIEEKGQDEDAILRKQAKERGMSYVVDNVPFRGFSVTDRHDRSYLYGYYIIVNQVPAQESLGICGYYNILHAYAYMQYRDKMTYDDILITITTDKVLELMKEFKNIRDPDIPISSCYSKKLPRFTGRLDTTDLRYKDQIKRFLKCKTPFIFLRKDHSDNIILTDEVINENGLTFRQYDNRKDIYYDICYRHVYDKLINTLIQYDLMTKDIILGCLLGFSANGYSVSDFGNTLDIFDTPHVKFYGDKEALKKVPKEELKCYIGINLKHPDIHNMYSLCISDKSVVLNYFTALKDKWGIDLFALSDAFSEIDKAIKDEPDQIIANYAYNILNKKQPAIVRGVMGHGESNTQIDDSELFKLYLVKSVVWKYRMIFSIIVCALVLLLIFNYVSMSSIESHEIQPGEDNFASAMKS